MFKIGFGEILVLFLLAVVFIRPSDLPRLFRNAGRLFARIRGLRREMEETVNRFEEEVRRAQEDYSRANQESRGQGDPAAPEPGLGPGDKDGALGNQQQPNDKKDRLKE